MSTISRLWDSSIVPTLTSYIRIPAKSPHFDKDWAKNGYIHETVEGTGKSKWVPAFAGTTDSAVLLQGR